MGGGLTFLSKKSFNPSNNINQKTVWEAEQIKDRESARLRERERQLRIERDHEELARARDGDRGADRATMTFMYDLPPGASSKQLRDGRLNNDDVSVGNSQTDGIPSDMGNGNAEESGNETLLQRKAGDDDAAAAFRLILAGGYNNSTESSSSLVEEGGCGTGIKGGGCVMTGSTAENTSTRDMSRLTQLEKAVGRKDTGGILSYDEQIARFPQLKNAPMALKRKGVDQFGDASTETANLNVNFKPLGAQIRNVRCLKCGVWGHSRGDRECKFGWDPFSVSTRPLETAKCTEIRGNDNEDSNRAVNSNKINELNPKDIALSDEDIIGNRGSSDDDSTNERRRIRRKKKRRKREKENNKRRKKKKRKRHVERKDEQDADSYDDDSCSYGSLEYERRSKRKGRSHSGPHRRERRTDFR